MEIITKKSKEGVELNRKNVKGKLLSCVEGLCATDKKDPKRPRTRKWYLENILGPKLKDGTISDHFHVDSNGVQRYDDRKTRLDFVRLNENIIEVGLGITLFEDVVADVHRAPDKNKKLKQRGLEEFNDEYAFFSRGCGIAGAPISKEGSIFLGQRANTKEYPLWLGLISGYIDFKENPCEIDLYQEIRREMIEEMAIMPGNIQSMEFIGFFENSLSGEGDFTFLAKTNLPNKYFSSGEWKKAKEIEHGNLIQIASYKDAQKLLNNSPESIPGIMYSTFGALKNIGPGDFQT